MILIITIFFIAIIGAFGMLVFRAWEIRTNRIQIEEENIPHTGKINWREVEKIALHLIKHVIQSIVLFIVKYWFLVITKTRIWVQNKLPKVFNFFQKKASSIDPRKISFVQRAIIESKIKIKRVKESIKKEHEEVIERYEVDKIV